MWQAGGEKRGEQQEECTVDEERKMRGRRREGGTLYAAIDM